MTLTLTPTDIRRAAETLWTSRPRLPLHGIRAVVQHRLDLYRPDPAAVARTAAWAQARIDHGKPVVIGDITYRSGAQLEAEMGAHLINQFGER